MKRARLSIPRLPVSSQSRQGAPEASVVTSQRERGQSLSTPVTVPPLHEGPSRPSQTPTAPSPVDVPQQRRADAPLVLPYSTGSAKRALAAVSDREQQQICRDTFEARASTAATKKSREARLKVWLSIAEQANCTGPLTAYKVKTIVGALLRAGFRSTQAYFAAAKRHHISTYKHWDAELDLVVSADVNRAAKRGLGPPSRASPFPLLGIAKQLDQSSTIPITCSSNEGPVHLWPCAVIATWGLFREIEIANASLADVKLNKEAKTLSILAPASKADAAALGSSITLACACGAQLAIICPYCIGRRHLACVCTLFGISAPNELVDKPLFPSASKSWCTKAGMIQGITDLASATGHAPTTRRGAQKWGGHSYRRGGAHMLAALGFSREDIKAVARHSSNAIDGYLDGADLNYIKLLLPSRFTKTHLEASATALVAPPSFPSWNVVMMARGGKVHACEPDSGRTLCGWPWSAAMARCVDASPHPVSCAHCCRVLRRQARAERPTSAVSSGSSSSDCSASSSGSAS